MHARDSIEERARRLLSDIPADVVVVAAAKTRTPDEVRAVLAAGISIVGENYVQETEAAQAAVSRAAARWHLIGHLQRNKVKDAVRLFDLIQTVDSIRLAEAIDAASRALGRVTPILVEVNSAREPQKSGVLPEDATDFVRALERLEAVRVVGLMTMGPLVADPEALRPAFRDTQRLFDRLRRLVLERARMQILSMGMSESYRVAIEESATMVRVGTALFGPRTS
ncbi:MAG: YggS family pyridoxal phosphate-dependent enzyme [Candidatus Bipolaricaulota bacterium]|nr:YggS family pyridoxal phosphate-dependent enzyme [Candidatus Bipolaricaulota bacterium]